MIAGPSRPAELLRLPAQKKAGWRHAPIVWTIAATDPSGGAGIQADIKIIHALGAHEGSIITAVIAQNSMGVHRIWSMAAAQVRSQWMTLKQDMMPDVIKLGVLSTASIVREVVRAIRSTRARVVCDPVLGSTGGIPLLSPAGSRALRDHLLPEVTVLTPNRLEAEVLLQRPLRSVRDLPRAARELLALGPNTVLLKGGHFGGSVSLDYFDDGHDPFWLQSPRVRGRHTHGTGCVLSSALAAFLAHGRTISEAVVLAKAYMNQALRLGERIGKGRGHPAHEGWPQTRRDLPFIRKSIA